jgi:hypothetical protein
MCSSALLLATGAAQRTVEQRRIRTAYVAVFVIPPVSQIGISTELIQRLEATSFSMPRLRDDTR